MKQKTLTAAIICLCLFLTYKSSIAQANNPGLQQIKSSIQKINTLYYELFAKSDASIINLYTDDAILLAPNMLPINGKKALKKDFEDTFVAGKVKGVKFQTGNIYGDGKAYITEEGTWQVFDQSGKVIDDGKYLKLWKLTKAGWKIFRDSFNSNHKI